MVRTPAFSRSGQVRRPLSGTVVLLVALMLAGCSTSQVTDPSEPSPTGFYTLALPGIQVTAIAGIQLNDGEFATFCKTPADSMGYIDMPASLIATRWTRDELNLAWNTPASLHGIKRIDQGPGGAMVMSGFLGFAQRYAPAVSAVDRQGNRLWTYTPQDDVEVFARALENGGAACLTRAAGELTILDATGQPTTTLDASTTIDGDLYLPGDFVATEDGYVSWVAHEEHVLLHAMGSDGDGRWTLPLPDGVAAVVAMCPLRGGGAAVLIADNPAGPPQHARVWMVGPGGETNGLVELGDGARVMQLTQLPSGLIGLAWYVPHNGDTGYPARRAQILALDHSGVLERQTLYAPDQESGTVGLAAVGQAADGSLLALGSRWDDSAGRKVLFLYSEP